MNALCVAVKTYGPQFHQGNLRRRVLSNQRAADFVQPCSPMRRARACKASLAPALCFPFCCPPGQLRATPRVPELTHSAAPRPSWESNSARLLPPHSPGGISLSLPASERANEAAAGTAVGSRDGLPGKPWGSEKSYLIPALEIIGFNAALNLFNRAYFGCCDPDVTLSSIWRNLKASWVTDDSTFTVNQLGHPYQGSMYHGFARASGLNYWEGLGYSFAGSLLWEIAGEKTPPSRNDLVTTSIGGSLLGEALFRIANLWLEQGKAPRLWRELGAAAISPPVGFNRFAFGQFRTIFPSNKPLYYGSIEIGAASATLDGPAPNRHVERAEAAARFALEYGLPGGNVYAYDRPFDYFSFEVSAATGIGLDTLMTTGLLLGTSYGGVYYRGIWGVYGSYDYIMPEVFRFASTALALGTTSAWRLTPSLALNATALAGLGYAAVSDIRDVENERANHYGLAPQAALALRLIMGDKAFDLSTRGYFLGDMSSGPRGGDDEVLHAAAALTWRLHREHAISLRYQVSRREADSPDLGGRTQKRETVGIYYSMILGDRRFGLGGWR